MKMFWKKSFVWFYSICEGVSQVVEILRDNESILRNLRMAKKAYETCAEPEAPEYLKAWDRLGMKAFRMGPTAIQADLLLPYVRQGSEAYLELKHLSVR